MRGNQQASKGCSSSVDIRARLCSTIAFASVTAFATPTTAAKGPARATICGDSGCAALQGHDELHPLWFWWVDAVLAAARAEAGPFFRIVVRQEALAA